MLAQGPYEVQAKLHNQASHEEGTADAEILPATGVVWYIDANGEKRVRQAGANDPSTRVAIVTGGAKTGPAYGAADPDANPMDQALPAGEHIYTMGFHRFDEARLRLSGNATADPVDSLVGWDADGTITDDDGAGNAPTTPIGRGIELIERTDAANLLRVAFL